MSQEQSPEARARMLSGLKPGGGRSRTSQYKRSGKISNAEHARQYGKEMIDQLVEIARHGEPDAARIVAANSVLERGFGRVIGNDPEATTPTQITVVTDVRSDSAGPRWTMPDGREPFAAPPPSGRPMLSGPVVEPPVAARLTEGPVRKDADWANSFPDLDWKNGPAEGPSAPERK